MIRLVTDTRNRLTLKQDVEAHDVEVHAQLFCMYITIKNKLVIVLRI